MSIVKNAFSSILKMAVDFKTEMEGTSGFSDTISFLNFDAHVEESKIPDTDLIGIQGFTLLGHDDPIFEIGVSFLVSTRGDENLFRHIDMVDFIFEKLELGSNFRLLNSSDGSDESYLYSMPGRAVLPMQSTDTRQIQHIMTSFSTARPSQQ